MNKWKITLSKEFNSDLNRLPANVIKKAINALERMYEDPWAQELHPEKIKSAEDGVHSSKADDGYRIVWKHIKPDHIVFCLVDKHDEAYHRAARKSFRLRDGVVSVVDEGAKPIETTGTLFQKGRKQDSKYGKLFLGYTDNELLEMGATEEYLSHIRALDDLNEIESIERLLPTDLYDHLLSLALGIVERPVVSDEKLRTSLEKYQGGDELYSFVNTEEFHRALDGSLEDWMLFLASSQCVMVNRDYNGSARIRGVAGSGKTVVALHRARYLARKPETKKVLFLTYGNRLPNVIKYLFEKLVGSNSPEIEKFECLSVHQLCSQIMRQNGLRPQVDDNLCKNALDKAILKVRQKSTLTSLFNRSSQFFQDEIRYSIKGRAINSLAEYLRIERSGRGTPLQETERQAVFEIYQAYEDQLKIAGKCDFDDFILETLRILRYRKSTLDEGEELTEYSHIIVDEIQDLTEATMRLVRTLVPAGENDLFLVGDGMQRIYPGGYSLSKLNIDVVGRSALLRKNYRNTQQILRAAHALINNEQMDDMEDKQSEATEPEFSVRQGELPILHGLSTPDGELSWINSEIERLRVKHGYKMGDFALVYRYHSPYKDLIQKYLALKMATQEITREPETYFGDHLKHTTFHSIKGLEFKVVFIIGVTDGQFVPRDDWTLEGDELEDYIEREKRLLYVAMTRARDLLYITYSRGQSSRFLEKIPNDYINRM